MPTRLIRDGILTSQRVDELSFEEEVFFRRLMSHVDDYGVAEAHIGLLRAALYPLRLERVRETHVARWLKGCAEAGVIGCYDVNGRQYVQILNFKQQTRSKAKHPLPDAEHMKTFVNGCFQPLTDVHLGVVGDGVVCEDVVGGGARSGRPESREALLSYAAELGLSEEEAEAFFDHFEANGWKQGGRTPIKSWQAALRNWKRRSTQFRKNSSGGGAAAGGDFDPSKPNAHTGGVAVAN